MILRLDPRHPLVWRTPWNLQFGADPALLRLDDVTETQERLLAALVVGVSRPGLTMIAGGSDDDVVGLLSSVAPLLMAPPIERVDLVSLAGNGPVADSLAEALRREGVHVENVSEGRPDLAILVHGYVTPPSLHGTWLRRDVPHLPVVINDRGATIGPLVEPGAGPCLLCLELHRRDADPAWPAIATQLLGRTPVTPAALALEATALACRIALDRLEQGPGAAVSVHIDAATGRRDYTDWQPHPECGCRGLLPLPEPEPVSAGRRETGWAGAALDPVPR